MRAPTRTAAPRQPPPGSRTAPAGAAQKRRHRRQRRRRPRRAARRPHGGGTRGGLLRLRGPGRSRRRAAAWRRWRWARSRVSRSWAPWRCARALLRAAAMKRGGCGEGRCLGGFRRVGARASNRSWRPRSCVWAASCRACGRSLKALRAGSLHRGCSPADRAWLDARWWP